ncbi:MAG: MBL fold metallo-hydrolase [Nocardioides sp.]|uniref:MBL fold metallo-hydrolase n=1 Tax=Nocardioides sp. TaxID=35761 RepID=UPI000C8FD0DD|nr:MBL fold metallo-hydrolase [Nocardioides sp.]MAS55949.1 MBL fold metallo-hydrolase [Pimelobacter sp.]MDE0775494.1 MBL fold metallo-hydrolase [Nocardioides sp.]
MLDVEVLDTSDLGDRSYVAHDGTTAVVIDPQRDIDRVEKVLTERRLTCVAVLETHMHNDYVTGGLELARRSEADYVVNAADPVEFVREPIRDGEQLTFGRIRFTAMATPGHTVTHLSYFAEDLDEQSAPAVFTGGSLLYGSVGRTDLVDTERTDELTRAQFRSARRLGELPGHARVFPTHGFGSFCSSGSAAGGDASTIAEERERNDALTATDEDTFVETLIANLTAYPAYYAHMGARNLQGPGPIDLSAPEMVDAAQLRKRLEAREWVVDLRTRTAYASAHLEGSIGIELGNQFSTYLGWLMPWGSALTLIGESAEQVEDAQRQLVRIGIDRPDAAAIGSPNDLATSDDQVETYPRVGFAELAALSDADRSQLTVLDTRRDDERAQGGIEGSTHIPLHQLLDRIDEVPSGPLWIHCASGFRASIAASLLARAGHEVTHIDDDYAKSDELGLT